MIIKVTKRQDDIHACIADNPGFWGCGQSIPEAIGNIVFAHPEVFGMSRKDIELDEKLGAKSENESNLGLM